MKNEIIIKTCLDVSELNRDAVFSKSRQRDIVKCRQLISWFIFMQNKPPLETVADIFGQRHPNIIHSIKQVDNLEFQNWQPYLEWKNEIKKRLDNYESSRKIYLKELHLLASTMNYYNFENWIAKELFNIPETVDSDNLTSKLFLQNER